MAPRPTASDGPSIGPGDRTSRQLDMLADLLRWDSEGGRTTRGGSGNATPFTMVRDHFGNDLISDLKKTLTHVLSRVEEAIRAAQLNALRDRLEEFVRLPEGWAGPGTVPPSSLLASQVGRLLEELPKDAPLPQATASGEGEIGLTWFRGDDCLDALASPDGHLTWVLKIGDAFLEGDVLELSSRSLAPFHEALADFHG